MTYATRNPLWPGKGPKWWLCHYVYYSPRYDKWKTVQGGMPSDGATGLFVPDLEGSASWPVHDAICEEPTWDDGTPIYPWQAALVLHDILHSEKRHLHDSLWALGTFVLGCRKTWGNVWAKLWPAKRT